MVSFIESYEVLEAYGTILEFYEVTIIEDDIVGGMFDDDIFAEEDQNKREDVYWWGNDSLQPICVLPTIGGDM